MQWVEGVCMSRPVSVSFCGSSVEKAMNGFLSMNKNSPKISSPNFLALLKILLPYAEFSFKLAVDLYFPWSEKVIKNYLFDLLKWNKRKLEKLINNVKGIFLLFSFESLSFDRLEEDFYQSRQKHNSNPFVRKKLRKWLHAHFCKIAVHCAEGGKMMNRTYFGHFCNKVEAFETSHQVPAFLTDSL